MEYRFKHINFLIQFNCFWNWAVILRALSIKVPVKNYAYFICSCILINTQLIEHVWFAFFMFWNAARAANSKT